MEDIRAAQLSFQARGTVQNLTQTNMVHRPVSRVTFRRSLQRRPGLRLLIIFNSLPSYHRRNTTFTSSMSFPSASCLVATLNSQLPGDLLCSSPQLGSQSHRLAISICLLLTSNNVLTLCSLTARAPIGLIKLTPMPQTQLSARPKLTPVCFRQPLCVCYVTQPRMH